MNYDYYQLNVHTLNWMLIMTRISCFFFAAPFFGSQAINKSLKAYIVAALAFFIYKSSAINPLTEVPSMFLLVVCFVKEMSVGIILTTLAAMIYQPARLIGVQIGRSAGLGRAKMFNPEENTQFTVIQQLVYLIGVLVFLAVNGHHMILNVMVATFKYIPLGGIFVNGKIVKVIIDFFSRGFSLGLQCAAPVMCCILISSLCFGILGKSVPQMNLLILGLPLRVFLAMMGLFFALPIVMTVYKKFIFFSYESLMKLVYIMGKGGV